MAALARHGGLKFWRIRGHSTGNTMPGRSVSKEARARMNVDMRRPPRIDSAAESIAARGFLRPQEGYVPPEDVGARLQVLFKKFGGQLADPNVKFELFTACAEEFGRCIPNSMLHQVETIADVKKFYETPVDTLTPLDRLKEMELPENLHVRHEYHRFHPDTDTKFKGQTAFNRSSTLVTGLKYKGKYKGHVQNQEWPYNS